MDTVELQTEPVIEDFEVGERVYFLNYKHNVIEYGRISGLYTSHMDVTLDNGKIPLAHLTNFASGGPMGKCFPMDQLQVGSVISVFHSGERVYADVIKITGERSVVIEYRNGKSKRVTIEATEGEPLEFKMACYILEG